jgi:putative component of toxin-antitoxin plasmid stabilization module
LQDLLNKGDNLQDIQNNRVRASFLSLRLEPGVQYRFYWEETDMTVVVSLYTYRRLAQWFLWSIGETQA